MAGLPRPWVFLGHTLERVGPPVYLLHFLRWLAEHDPRPFEVVSLAGGDLRQEYEALCPVTIVDGPPEQGQEHASGDLAHLADPGLIHVNTAISVRAALHLPAVDAPWVAHVHELEIGLSLHTGRDDWRQLARPGARWVAASRAVAVNLASRHGVAEDEIRIHHEMVDAHVSAPEVSPFELRRQLEIPPSAPVIGTAAVVNWRKAPDLFLQVAWRLAHRVGTSDAHFVWLGADDGEASIRFRDDIRAAGLEATIHVVPVVAEPRDWMAMFDVFALPSREDAFPLACLEAAAAACPIVCFDSGGMPEFVEGDCGVVVPFPDVPRFADAIERLLTDRPALVSMGQAAREKVLARHDVRVAAPRLHADLSAWSR